MVLCSSTCVFHCSSSSAAWRSWPRSSPTSDHAGVDAVDLPVGFLSLVAAHQQPAGATGDIGHVRPRWSRVTSRPARRRSQRSAAHSRQRLLTDVNLAMSVIVLTPWKSVLDRP